MDDKSRTTGRNSVKGLTGYEKQGKTGWYKIDQHLQILQKDSEKEKQKGGADVTGHLKGLSVECTCRTWLLRWSGLEGTERALAHNAQQYTRGKEACVLTCLYNCK